MVVTPLPPRLRTRNHPWRLGELHARIYDAVVSRRWGDYVREHTEGMSQGAVAAAAGVHQSTVSRWLTHPDEQPRAEHALGLARALGRSPVEALIDAGYLEAGEVDAVELGVPIGEQSDAELLRELAYRLSSRAAGNNSQVGGVTGLTRLQAHRNKARVEHADKGHKHRG